MQHRIIDHAVQYIPMTFIYNWKFISLDHIHLQVFFFFFNWVHSITNMLNSILSFFSLFSLPSPLGISIYFQPEKWHILIKPFPESIDSIMCWIYFNARSLSPLTAKTAVLWVFSEINFPFNPLSPSLLLCDFYLFSFSFPFSYWEVGEFSSLRWWADIVWGNWLGLAPLPRPPQRTECSITVSSVPFPSA